MLITVNIEDRNALEELVKHTDVDKFIEKLILETKNSNSKPSVSEVMKLFENKK